MASVLQDGRTRPAALPACAGQMGSRKYRRRRFALILQGKRSRAAFRPASRDLVFLTDAGFVLEPEFEWLAAGRGDRRQDVRDFFFKRCDSRLVMGVVARPRREV